MMARRRQPPRCSSRWWPRPRRHHRNVRYAAGQVAGHVEAGVGGVMVVIHAVARSDDDAWNVGE